MKKQARRTELFIDKRDEMLRLRFYSFLDELHKGRVPDGDELRTFFVDDLGIKDVKSCRSEIEFLEEQIYHHEGEMEPTSSVLNGFVALVRYARFLLFGFEEDDMQVQARVGHHKKAKVGIISKEIADTFLTVPKDFCCPISLDLMEDPVIICTGQSYDRAYIIRWMDDGHCTCPKTGQMLTHTRVVPNQALRNLISQWCTAHGIAFECPDATGCAVETFAAALPTKAAIEANKATTALLIRQLASGTQGAKALAALEIRLLAKTGKENRAIIAEAGAIHHLRKLLPSSDMVAQENAVTAVLNLSIHEKNKSRIMDEEGCLESIVDVLRFGLTTEARENAAATLFSLSAVHDYKKRIAYERGAIEALALLLNKGTPRGKKDAVTALFNLSTHSENCSRMIEAGGVKALVGALGVDGVAEEAAGALALLVRQQMGAQAVAQEESAVTGLTGMMRSGSARGKENAVAVLLEICRSGGAAATQRVITTPAMANLLESLLFTGTKRARRKAASLARVFLKNENAGLHFVGLGIGYAISHNSTANRDSSYTSSAVNRDSTYTSDVNMPIPISLPVL
uniref:RING-type E3 ubiquitin transferase n=1 Tax=Kalanchoe fedtschenkoi TaxID=63787 RepID=A0A7N0RED9_KALFE